MKTNRLFLMLLVAMLCMCNLSAQEIIHVDSTHLLSKEQKETLQYAKKIAMNRSNKFRLPVEINNVLGNSSSKRYDSTLKLNEAYFVNRRDFKAVLVIPMQAKIDTVTINSEFNLLSTDNVFYSIIYTTFDLPSDSVPQYMCMKSSVNGFLFSTVFVEGDKIVAEVEGENADKAYMIFENNNKNNNKNKFSIPKGLRIPSLSDELRKNHYRLSNLSSGEKYTEMRH